MRFGASSIFFSFLLLSISEIFCLSLSSIPFLSLSFYFLLPFPIELTQFAFFFVCIQSEWCTACVFVFIYICFTFVCLFFLGERKVKAPPHANSYGTLESMHIAHTICCIVSLLLCSFNLFFFLFHSFSSLVISNVIMWSAC